MRSAPAIVIASPRRMLTLREAADYCGIPVKRFPVACSARPVAMPHGKLLYDVKDLDVWLDGVKGNCANTDEEIIRKLQGCRS